jgi:hypothetical protein
MPMAHACNPSYLARAEIVRIIVWAQTGQKSLWDPHVNGKRLGAVAFAWEKKWDPISKITKTKRAGGITQMLEELPSAEFKPQYCQKIKKNPSSLLSRKMKWSNQSDWLL